MNSTLGSHKPGPLNMWPKRLESRFRGRDNTKLKKGKRPKTSHVSRVCVYYIYGTTQVLLLYLSILVWKEGRSYSLRMIRGTRSAWTTCTFLGLRPLRPGGFCCREVPERNGVQFGFAVEKSKGLI